MKRLGFSDILRNIAIGFDQLGNAWTAGNPDSTISARTGYFLSIGESKFWAILSRIIDFAFWPWDGADHCLQALESDKDEEFYEARGLWRVWLAFIVLVFCIVISVISYITLLFRKIF